VENKNAFIATEYIRKGKWEKLPDNIKEEMKSRLSDREGELYFSILIYHPQEFYSVLLTYHTAVYDIWLMTLDPVAITFRLDSLLGSLSSYKNSEKELLSIIKVFEELNKEKKRMEKTTRDLKSFGGTWNRMDITKILADVQEKINTSGDKKFVENLRKN
ncbi:12302_t:CDS:2, partial [Racocetra persica]